VLLVSAISVCFDFDMSAKGHSRRFLICRMSAIRPILDLQFGVAKSDARQAEFREQSQADLGSQSSKQKIALHF
jgi:hypothetical protein